MIKRKFIFGVIIIMFCAVVVLSGCKTETAQVTSTQSETVQTADSATDDKIDYRNDPSKLIDEDGTGEISLGMTLDEIIKKLDELGVEYNHDEDWIHIDNIGFALDNNGVLYQISYTISGAQTSKGLKKGDNYAKMAELYGNKYTVRDENDLTYYIYKHSGANFVVTFDGDKILYIEISINS